MLLYGRHWDGILASGLRVMEELGITMDFA